MDRVRKLKLNTYSSLINRFVIMLSGLVLPRIILVYFGSETNGLIASIGQFLSIITFLDLGVGSVVQSALYKPLHQKNSDKISLILSEAKIYFRRIAYFLVLYVVLLAILYPILLGGNQDFFTTSFLIIAMSLNIFAQYYFGIIKEFLLNADQRAYVQLSAETIVVLLNLIVSVILIMQGHDIHIVKLFTSLIFFIRPIYLTYYVNKNFDINYSMDTRGSDPLPQKWNGVGQHIAYSIQNSTDIVIITIFTTLENVSIYSVYNMVVNSISLLISSFTTGLTSFFGNLIAEGENKLLKRYFEIIEWTMHTSVIFLYALTAVLIGPFVLLYTNGIEDVIYYAPTFAILLVISKALYSLRTPYQSMVLAAGHFKQTQASSIIEAITNVVISLILVFKFGLVGVVIGSLLAMVYRIFYLAYYLSKNIINRPIKHIMKHFCVDIISFIGIMYIGNGLMNIIDVKTVAGWLIFAVLLGVLSIIYLMVLNTLLFKNTVLFISHRIIKNLNSKLNN